MPKDKVSIVITTPDSNLVHKAFESYRTMKDRGETAILLLTIDRPIAQVKESLDMCMNEACLINKPANVADFIEEYIKDRPSKVYEVTMAEQVKMMTWKLEGLAEDQVRLLCNTFSSPKKVLKAASNRTECTPETPLDSVLKDVNCWIAQDYYVE